MSTRVASSRVTNSRPIPGGPAGLFAGRAHRTTASPRITRIPPAICTSKRTMVPGSLGSRVRMNIPPGEMFVANRSTNVPTSGCLSFTRRPTA